MNSNDPENVDQYDEETLNEEIADYNVEEILDEYEDPTEEEDVSKD